MAFLILEDSTNENLKLLLALAKKLEIKISEVSIEDQEDLLFGKMMLNEETEEYASRDELFNELNKK
jgi:hypothetical protein